MLIETLNISVQSTTLSSSLIVPITWISLVGSKVVLKKTTKVITFKLSNSKTRKLMRKHFAQIMKLPISGTFYEVTNDQVLYMFNDMGASTYFDWHHSL